MANTRKLERKVRIQAKRKARRELKEAFRTLSLKAKREFRTGELKSLPAFVKKQQEAKTVAAAAAAKPAAEAAPAAESQS